MSGTSLGRHARPGGDSQQHAGARIAKTAARGAAWVIVCALIAAIAIATYAIILTTAAVAHVWRRLGVHGRFIAAMIAAPFTAVLGAAVGVLPAGYPVILIAGAAGVAVFGTWLRLVTWRGQRQWRRREHPAVVHGGLDADVSSNTKRLAQLEAEVAQLRRIVSAVGEETGIALPEGMAPRRHLWAVGDDSGPLPKIS